MSAGTEERTRAQEAAARPESEPVRHASVIPYWQAVGAIVWKDLRAELRSRELVNSMLLFTLMTVMVFSLAMELNANARQNIVAGVLWVTVIFAGLLGLGRSLAAEKDRGSLDALLLAPIDRSALFFGKMIGNLLFVWVVGLMLLVLLTVLFNITMVKPLIALIVLLGTLGFTTIGTLLSSMTVHARAREALLPIVLMPAVLPVLMPAVRATTAVLNEMPTSEWVPWVRWLALADVLFLFAAYLLFDYVVEE
ncbi:MAG TPA: heme exporter protein CcmB [Aggregatilinea sp.]|uniref:heme exporter protein CcmB n=1 Tax=Aggregatilinea sp. TaxID=2806333 RepID=UPI002C8E59F1|nr:heme exporter protein CcmB [Aggregatilinea sp.]HML23927.1 heme exporter protein CcmB [Aggregatilinea sp.]